jgi:hypothetical protein
MQTDLAWMISGHGFLPVQGAGAVRQDSWRSCVLLLGSLGMACGLCCAGKESDQTMMGAAFGFQSR